MQRTPPLTLEFINSRLEVDCENGIVYWIDPTKHHRHLIGCEAGCLTEGRSNKNYWIIRLNGTGYKRSYIIFTVATGRWPTKQIDHKDGDSLNDKYSNLRECTQLQNMWNTKRKNKLSDLPMGVRKMSSSSKFQSRIAVNRKTIHLGAFDTPQEAEQAYLAARVKYYGDFA